MTSPGPGSATDAPVCYRHPQRQTYVSCQRCGRPICPECQTVAPVGVQCPECVREGGATVKAGRGPGILRALRPSGRPVVTFTLIGLCIVLYIAQVASGNAVTRAWVLDPSVIASQPWRLLTSVFLHGSPIHLLFNMYVLFAIGPTLESFLGRARYLALYLISGLGGSVAMVLLFQITILTTTSGPIYVTSALGASGAIFGVIGAVFVLRKVLGVQTMQLLIYLGINLAIGFFVPGIAWEAHIGGLAVGAAIAAVYLFTRRRELRTRQITAVVGIAVSLAAIVIACVAALPNYYS
ncbi:rhomboid family intramembrane serine protease [soil metagenome]